MQTISLFADGEFVLEADQELEQASVEAGMFDEFVVASDAVTAAEAIAEAGPRFSERALIQSLVNTPATVVVHALNRKGVSVTACDLDSAYILMRLLEGTVNKDTGGVAMEGVSTVRPDISPVYLIKKVWDEVPTLIQVSGQKDEKYKNTSYRNKIYFGIKDAIAPTFEESRIYKFLRSLGLTVVVSPSFDNWVPREYRRQVRDNTPFLLPEILDTRPLYDRLEEGTVVKCTTAAQRNRQNGTAYVFEKDKQYIVGEKVSPNEDLNEEGHAMLHLFGSGSGRVSSVAYQWSSAEPMEPFFEAVQKQEVIYDPAKCVPEVYKSAFEANRARIEQEKWQLFDHTVFDACQAAVKPVYLDGKLMRMGKTRAAIVFLKLRNCKKTAFFTDNNILGFVERELDVLGIKDYRVVNSYKTMRAEKQPWMELIPYGWMKYQRDPISKAKTNYHCARTGICPHCSQTMERRILVETPNSDGNGVTGTWQWTPDFGYICRNQDCRIQTQRIVCAGAAWGPIGPQPTRTITKTWGGTIPIEGPGRTGQAAGGLRGSGYLDIDRKVHARHVQINTTDYKPVQTFEGRRCTDCGFIEQAWIPAPYRRLKNRYDGAAFDEIHKIKSGSSDITQAVLSLHLPVIAGLTGTLMPNDPSDAFWPLFRIFGNDTHRFAYGRTAGQPYKGVTAFNADFTDTVTIENTDRETSYKKRLPYMKNVTRFHRLMAPKMIRRSYDDPLVIQSLEKAGLKVPEAERKVIVIPPDPKQAALMLASMQEFDQAFQDYRQSLRERGTDDRTYLINTSYVISRMTRMRMGATVPDYINIRLAKQNLPPMYLGARGGAKMEQVYNLCMSKCANGEKVLILSDFQDMQRLMAEELSLFKPILFNTSWNKGRRQEAFDLFNEDPDFKVFIAGPRAIGLGVDLAGGPDSLCRTVISTDLLWRPGEQQQAWARIMKPSKEKYTVQVYILVLDASIDRHVYSTFYSKLFAAEQALDRRIITQKEKAFDVGAFVDQVLADRDKMVEYLQRAGEDELSYLPYVEMFSMEDREA